MAREWSDAFQATFGLLEALGFPGRRAPAGGTATPVREEGVVTSGSSVAEWVPAPWLGVAEHS